MNRVVRDDPAFLEIAMYLSACLAFLFGLRFVVDWNLPRRQRHRIGVQRFENPWRGRNVCAGKRFDDGPAALSALLRTSCARSSHFRAGLGRLSAALAAMA
jgi:hypothetical protein